MSARPVNFPSPRARGEGQGEGPRRRASVLACVLVALVPLAACGTQPKPETLVDNLRVLAITSDPPEIHPGDTAELGILELDPSRPGGKTTVVWVGCDPDPFGLGRSACNDTTALLQPTSFTDFPPGVRLLGFGPHAAYAVPKDLFGVLAPDDPLRENGVVGQILAVVIGEEVKPTSSNEELRALFTRIEKQEVQSLMGLTRATVSERGAPNQNPVISGLAVDGATLPQGATVLLQPGQEVKLELAAPAESRESYVLRLPSGDETRTEHLVVSWYSTGGRFTPARADLDTGSGNLYIAPGSTKVAEDPVPDKRQGSLWAVLRDNRGGQVWQQFPFFVCDGSLPPPVVRNVQLPAAMGEAVVVTGDAMSSAVDVLIGGVALPNGSWSPGRQAFLGDLPTLPAGTYPVTVRTKTCAELDTGLTVSLP